MSVELGSNRLSWALAGPSQGVELFLTVRPSPVPERERVTNPNTKPPLAVLWYVLLGASALAWVVVITNDAVREPWLDPPIHALLLIVLLLVSLISGAGLFVQRMFERQAELRDQLAALAAAVETIRVSVEAQAITNYAADYAAGQAHRAAPPSKVTTMPARRS